jgi:hypothetical protein
MKTNILVIAMLLGSMWSTINFFTRTNEEIATLKSRVKELEADEASEDSLLKLMVTLDSVVSDNMDELYGSANSQDESLINHKEHIEKLIDRFNEEYEESLQRERKSIPWEFFREEEVPWDSTFWNSLDTIHYNFTFPKDTIVYQHKEI